MSYALVMEEGHIRKLILSTGYVSTIAGDGTTFFEEDGIGTNVRFGRPQGITLSSDETLAIITDTLYNTVRRLILTTTMVTTIAGGGNQVDSLGEDAPVGTSVMFSQPVQSCISPDDTIAYVLEYEGARVRRVYLSTGAVNILAGGRFRSGDSFYNGVGTFANFYNPSDMAMTPDGSALYVLDSGNRALRKIITSTALVSEINDIWTNPFGSPASLALTPVTSATVALMTDVSAKGVFVVNLNGGWLSAFLGGSYTSGDQDGVGTTVTFRAVQLLRVSADESFALILDQYKVRHVQLTQPAPTSSPTASPTRSPTAKPTRNPTYSPTAYPTRVPTPLPSSQPSRTPSSAPSSWPTTTPSSLPSTEPSSSPSVEPSSDPSGEPTSKPSAFPSGEPSSVPSSLPSGEPSSAQYWVYC